MKTSKQQILDGLMEKVCYNETPSKIRHELCQNPVKLADKLEQDLSDALDKVENAKLQEVLDALPDVVMCGSDEYITIGRNRVIDEITDIIKRLKHEKD